MFCYIGNRPWEEEITLGSLMVDLIILTTSLNPVSTVSIFFFLKTLFLFIKLVVKKCMSLGLVKYKQLWIFIFKLEFRKRASCFTLNFVNASKPYISQSIYFGSKYSDEENKT